MLNLLSPFPSPPSFDQWLALVAGARVVIAVDPGQLSPALCILPQVGLRIYGGEGGDFALQ